MANYNIMDKKYHKMFDTIDKVKAYLEPIADNICGETGLNCNYTTDNLNYPTTGHFRTYYKMRTKGETRKYNESYRYYKDCVFFKMRDVEISYRRYDKPQSPFNLQPNSITYAGIRKLRELHKKYCPTIRKGNWKHLSIKQLGKIIEEFDRFDKAIILALKKKIVLSKVAEIEKDF